MVSMTVPGLTPRKDLVFLALVCGVPLALFLAIDASFVSGMLLVLVGMIAVLLYPLAILLRSLRAPRGARVSGAVSASRDFGLALVTFFAVQAVGMTTGQWVTELRVEAAKRWCEELAVKLEDHRRAHGEYPSKLDGAAWLADRPMLCDQDGLGYRASDGEYTVFFYTERGFDSAWRYESRTRAWHYSS